MTDAEGGLAEPAELEPEQGSLRLAADRHDAAAWEAAAAAVLRRARRLRDEDPDSAVWQALTRTTLDGIEVPPIGTPETAVDVASTHRPTRAGDWDVRTHVSGPDGPASNEAALVDLENGATSLWVRLGVGLSAADLPALLDGVLVELAPVVLQAGTETVAAATALVGVAEGHGARLEPRTNFGADPIGDRLRGHALVDVREVLEHTATLAHEHDCLAWVVDATAVHDLGASDAQELGYSLATAIAYLRVAGHDADRLGAHPGLLEFRYAATDEQFPTIAKLRAARRLWARVLELSGAEPGRWPQRQHAVTSRPMMSKYDPWVNMLRGTVGAFAAGVGGAEAVTVLPFDEPLGLPDAFGRRIARNTSSLLISESHVARVADPAGGAYAVERLTHELAVAAWAELQRIEEAGGITAALDDGSLHERIDAVVEERDRQVALRTRPITGLSEFPHLDERLPERAPSAASEVRRYGAAYEALRDRPATTPVFLATLGPVAAFTARATFAANLLAAGGIAVEPAGPTDGVEAVRAAYAGQPVVCLAGTDAAYDAWGADVAAALRADGARLVVVVGGPREWADDSAAVGVDALAFLTRTREALG